MSFTIFFSQKYYFHFLLSTHRHIHYLYYSLSHPAEPSFHLQWRRKRVISILIG
ncbi:hypothetical protein CARUB_v10002403mg [Capsella rubella]|uniref:Uncharacterized protein n=1 Tax=Capsella rubella TaxID=81985 RepID=R0FIP9_9BRAS|nr:hypothetical protein CARUB_v10002403mg [Capsella rubella]EOA21921.1 hypothetical protein CARUB_v10002403mg [Capsella rubella]